MATYAKTISGQPAASTSQSPQLPWTAIGWFAALLLVCYIPVLTQLIHVWSKDGDMGHGFFVPIVAGYIVWQRRAELAAIRPEPNYLGLIAIAVGAILMVIGTLGAQIFIARVAFLISLAGVVYFLGGKPIMRVVAFPLFLLVFMIPIPVIIYSRITLPLQLFASTVAEHILALLGIPVLRDGNVLELASQRLSVVEACSGIRSLLSLTFLALVYGYFFDSKPWMRWLLLAATIPIAIMANASRVTLTGLISEYRVDLAQGVFHTLEGWVLFIVALVLLIGFHQLANKIYYASHPLETSNAAA
jgi:exosortase